MTIKELRSYMGSIALAGVAFVYPGGIIVLTYRNRVYALKTALSKAKAAGIRLRVYGAPRWFVKGKLAIYDRTTSFWWKKF